MLFIFCIPDNQKQLKNDQKKILKFDKNDLNFYKVKYIIKQINLRKVKKHGKKHTNKNCYGFYDSWNNNYYQFGVNIYS